MLAEIAWDQILTVAIPFFLVLLNQIMGNKKISTKVVTLQNQIDPWNLVVKELGDLTMKISEATKPDADGKVTYTAAEWEKIQQEISETRAAILNALSDLSSKKV